MKGLAVNAWIFFLVIFWAKSDNLPDYLHLEEKNFKIGSLPYLAAGSFCCACSKALLHENEA